MVSARSKKPVRTMPFTLKSLEALGVLANGKATKIVVPSDLQGLASLATTFKGIVEEQKVPAGKEVQK